MGECIRFDHVTVRYGEQRALDDLCLSLEEGEFLTIIGRSGCGKTTALRLINGLCTPNEGKVSVYGKKRDCLSLQ